METRNDIQAKEIAALKDAIKHCSEVENSCVGVMCSLEHKQLRIWLKWHFGESKECCSS